MIAALLAATRDVIINQLKYDPTEVMVLPDGKPSPTCGDRFIAIHGNSLRPDIIDQNLGIDARADITITYTRRMSANPYDTRGNAIYMDLTLEMENTLNEITRYVHQNYALITIANGLLIGTNKIIEPLRWLGGDAVPEYANADWFSSQDGSEMCGLIMKTNFGNARRMQTTAGMR